MERPAFQFYPGDWQRDAALRSCSIGARGLWVEMICIMHQAEPYGHLVVNGKPIQPTTLARMVGCTAAECSRFLAELESSGVYSWNGDVIVSRRMVRDDKVRVARAAGGKLGGNPALKDRPKDDKKVNGKVNLNANLPPTPSSSVFSLQSSKTLTPLSGKPDVTHPEDWDFKSPPPVGKEPEYCIAFLNRITGKHFQAVEANLKFVRARLKESTVSDIKRVITYKAEQWETDPKMEEYLRPATLFNAEKFAQYIGELPRADA